MRHLRRLRVIVSLTALVVILTVAQGALVHASPSLTLVSGPSPFAACTIGFPAFGGPSINYVNAEVEPRVAVNPTDPTNIVGVFQQDRWSNGAAHGLVASVSHDGGKSWHESWAHFSACAGGTAANGGDYERTSDPWVSFAPNGDVYQIALSFSFSTSSPTSLSAVLVSKSTTGGDTWSEPITLIRDNFDFAFNDKESITADPTNASYVYAVWERADLSGVQASASRADIWFSRTTDGGATWEPARAIFAPKNHEFSLGNQIAVLPNGTLVDIFDLLQAKAGRFAEAVAVIRSTDKGATWSQPSSIAQDLAVPVTDPDTGFPVRTDESGPEIAVDRSTGTLYAVWADGRFSSGAHDDIALSRSTDGGLTWSAPVKINQTTNNAAAFTPAVSVAANGTVGVTYYDFRQNTPAAGVPTDYWLVRCPARTDCTNPANWSETHVVGPFDIETAPIADGYFLGDYEGLTTVGSDFSTFLPFFVQTNTGNTNNPTDVFTTTI